jgi:hypothetical protein
MTIDVFLACDPNDDVESFDAQTMRNEVIIIDAPKMSQK